MPRRVLRLRALKPSEARALWELVALGRKTVDSWDDARFAAEGWTMRKDNAAQSAEWKLLAYKDGLIRRAEYGPPPKPKAKAAPKPKTKRKTTRKEYPIGWPSFG